MTTFRVTFYDVRRETFEVVDNVAQLDSCQFRIQSRLTNVWFLHLANCAQKAYPQKWYRIQRIQPTGGATQ